MPKVTRSRDSWRTSFTATARRRRKAAEALLAMSTILARGHDEYVLQAGPRALDARLDGVLRKQRAQIPVRIAMVPIHQHPQPDAQLSDSMHPGQRAQQPRRIAAVGA